MDNFLTKTCIHKRPDGSGALATVQTGVVCSPADPLSATPSQEYPIEKLLLLREFFTRYAAFQPGDYATFLGTDYPVRSVHPWDEQGGLDTFYRVIVEVKSGS